MLSYVVYESMYGHTHAVASAIAEALQAEGDVIIGSISEIAPSQVLACDLLIVGGPTHMHGISRPSTRKAAVETARDDDTVELDAGAPGPGLRDWLERLELVEDGRFAAFDTRADKPVLLVGSAAKGIAKLLRKRGFTAAVDPESFFVDSTTGPLHGGELERAAKWGAALSSTGVAT